MTASNQKKTTLYCRPDQGDSIGSESNNIQNQKVISRRYVTDHHFPSPCFYVDDGYSGASFQRPGLQQMMADVENGEIGIIIMKDPSRLGRNRLHTGLCIEKCFPMFGVRCIAINSNMDIDSSKGSELMSLKNLLNEWYIRDPNRKVWAAPKAKAERGERLGTRAPYGYKKDEADNKKLMVDEEATTVVRRIFAICVASRGSSQTARKLREEQILCPTTYARQKFGTNHASLNMEKPFRWTSSIAANMLENKLYLGNTVNMRFNTKPHKGKHRMEHPKEKCLVLEGTRPVFAIREIWDAVQRMR